MSAPLGEPQTLVLGAVAGATIVLGLPVGRMRAHRPALRQFLNALAIGILGFLLWDVLSGAWEPVDAAVADVHDGVAGLGPVLGYGLLFLGGLTVGLIGLVYYERWLIDRRSSRPRSLSAAAVVDRGVTSTATARQTALLIAVGIGLHNFGEGLAIGSSAAVGAIGLATVLVIGFALHNATEGFGIVAPLAAAGDRPSWGALLLLGLVAGGPTFVGTAVGYQFTSEALVVLFLTLAAGSIIYVLVQLTGVSLKLERRDLLYWGILAGLALGFATDLVVSAGGV